MACEAREETHGGKEKAWDRALGREPAEEGLFVRFSFCSPLLVLYIRVAGEVASARRGAAPTRQANAEAQSECYCGSRGCRAPSSPPAPTVPMFGGYQNITVSPIFDSCSAVGENCIDSGCCHEPGYTCMHSVKHPKVAMCRRRETPCADTEEWLCPRGDQCTPIFQDCRSTLCCQKAKYFKGAKDVPFECVRRPHLYYAQCRPVYEPDARHTTGSIVNGRWQVSRSARTARSGCAPAGSAARPRSASAPGRVAALTRGSRASSTARRSRAAPDGTPTAALPTRHGPSCSWTMI